jgi:hypothetical protein
VLSEGERVQGYNEMGATVFLGNEEGGALVVQDGGQYIPKFATADDVASATGEEVYVERFSATGEREFHGWIDAVSRKIVQTG